MISKKIQYKVREYRAAILKNNHDARERIWEESETNQALRKELRKVNHEFFLKWRRKNPTDSYVFGRR